MNAAFPGQFAHQFNIIETRAQNPLNHIGPNGDAFIQTMWRAPDYSAIKLLRLQGPGLVDRRDTHDQGVMLRDPSGIMGLDESQSSMLQQHCERTKDAHSLNETATLRSARPVAVRSPHTDQLRPQAENISVPPPPSATMPSPLIVISLTKPEIKALHVQSRNNQSSAPETLVNMATQQSLPAALASPIGCEENFVEFLQGRNARPPNSKHFQNRPQAESAKPLPKVAHTRRLFSEHMRQHPPQALRLKEALRQPDLVGPNTAKSIENALTPSALYQSPSPKPASPRRRTDGMKTVPGYAQPATQQSLSQQGRRLFGLKTVDGSQKATPAGQGSSSVDIDLFPHTAALSMSLAQQTQPCQPAEGAPILNGPLDYLDRIKVQFADQPEVYKKFLNIMRAFKSDT